MSAAVRNNAPVAVKGVVLKVEFVDQGGKLREFQQTIGQRLGAGAETAEATTIRGIADANDLARRVRLTVVAANPAED